MSSEPTKEAWAEFERYLERAEREMLPQMASSALNAMIWSGTRDVKLMLELGAAIAFDKPLLVILVRGAALPAKLRLVADEVVEIDGDMQSAENRRLVDAAIDRILIKAR